MNGSLIFKERIYPVLFMLVLTLIFIGIVSAIYLSTREVVLLNESLFLKKALLYAADFPVPEGSTEAEEAFQTHFREVGDGRSGEGYFEILQGQGSQVVGYAFLTSGAGLWGEIEAVLAFEKDLKTLRGIEFTKQNETPGLGARITEQWFKEQFRRKKGPFVFVPEGEAAGSNEVDAITGATRTSEAVKAIVNRAVNEAGEFVGGGN
ncbi:MAG: FMN-binding protein [Spirochaetales bacterium]|nr:FMN-binding protein [Spirochaetales bacterium]